MFTMHPAFLNLLQVAFWLSVCCVVYAYVGYPVVVYVAARLFGRKPEAPTLSPSQAPKVSLVIAALNEESVLEERIENFLSLNYPTDRMELLLASDGSTDGTTAIGRRYADQYPGRVRLLDYPERRGKATVLNVTLPQASGEIVAFSDANTFYDKQALQKLVRWFTNPEVGAVCGKLKLISPETGTNVDSLYWRYETFLKSCEGRLGALLGSNGAIYALRRADYVPIAGDTVIDDFMIPMLVKRATGKRIIFDEEAIATEETPADHRAEFRRRTRIGAGGFQSLSRLPHLLMPHYGWTSFTFWSHKVCRWSCPFFLLVAFVANAFLLGSPPYNALFVTQLGFYAVALVGNFVPGRSLPLRVLRLTTMFVSMNAALAIGFWRWISGLQRGTWHRTERQPISAKNAASTLAR
jgi:cellulose synthase/poly-beta-1,6-N-acetylglucosamine synthase-like glycosyltransferase